MFKGIGPIRVFVSLVLGGLLALLAASAACGGDDDFGAPPPEATDEEDGSEDNGSTSAPDGAAEPVVVEVGETFWHSGFKVTVEQATYEGTEPDFFGEVDWTVTVDATFENLGEDTTLFTADVALVTGSKSWEQSGASDLPSVPGELSSEGTIVFLVDDSFDFEDASLLIGSADENRASVPLGPGGGELVALEPEEPAVTGQIALELITLDFDGAELRADDPSIYGEMDDGKLRLTLDFSATSRKSGNWQIFPAYFALTLPDGGSVPVFSGGHAGLPGSDAGTTTSDLVVVFEVDDPAAGDYTLRFTPADYWIENGPTEGEFSFTLE
jgi:hypothetical protein